MDIVEFRTSLHDLIGRRKNAPDFEDTESGRRFLRRSLHYLTGKELRKFFKERFDKLPRKNGRAEMLKDNIIDSLVDVYFGGKPFFLRRVEEKFNLQTFCEEDKRNVPLCGVLVPYHVFLLILRFYGFENEEIVHSLGSVHSKWYLIILSSWPSISDVKTAKILHIPLVVLQNVAALKFHRSALPSTMTYIFSRLNPQSIRKMKFDFNMLYKGLWLRNTEKRTSREALGQTRLRSFLRILQRGNIVFRNCSKLDFGDSEHLHSNSVSYIPASTSLPLHQFSSEDEAKRKRVEFGYHFPNLRILKNAGMLFRYESSFTMFSVKNCRKLVGLHNVDLLCGDNVKRIGNKDTSISRGIRANLCRLPSNFTLNCVDVRFSLKNRPGMCVMMVPAELEELCEIQAWLRETERLETLRIDMMSCGRKFPREEKEEYFLELKTVRNVDFSYLKSLTLLEFYGDNVERFVPLQSVKKLCVEMEFLLKFKMGFVGGGWKNLEEIRVGTVDLYSYAGRVELGKARNGQDNPNIYRRQIGEKFSRVVLMFLSMMNNSSKKKNYCYYPLKKFSFLFVAYHWQMMRNVKRSSIRSYVKFSKGLVNLLELKVICHIEERDNLTPVDLMPLDPTRAPFVLQSVLFQELEEYREQKEEEEEETKKRKKKKRRTGRLVERLNLRLCHNTMPLYKTYISTLIKSRKHQKKKKKKKKKGYKLIREEECEKLEKMSLYKGENQTKGTKVVRVPTCFISLENQRFDLNGTNRTEKRCARCKKTKRQLLQEGKDLFKCGSCGKVRYCSSKKNCVSRGIGKDINLMSVIEGKLRYEIDCSTSEKEKE